MTDKAFEQQVDHLEEEPVYRTAKPKDVENGVLETPSEEAISTYLEAIKPPTDLPVDSEEVGRNINELMLAQLQQNFKPLSPEELTPERIALAEARLRGVAGVLAQESLNFFEYLQKVGIPFTESNYYESDENSDVDQTPKKAIVILLEDIAAVDMKRSSGGYKLVDFPERNL